MYAVVLLNKRELKTDICLKFEVVYLSFFVFHFRPVRHVLKLIRLVMITLVCFDVFVLISLNQGVLQQDQKLEACIAET